MAFDLAPYRHLYPFASHWLNLDGLRYHYLDEGAGDPVVCVHGNPSWSFYYRNVVLKLRDAHRVLAVDHIGCGLSDKPSDRDYPYVLSRRIDDLERFLDALGLTENVTLILHDWGGMIGMGAALRRVERIARIVLLNTAAFLLPEGRRLPRRLRLIRDAWPLNALLVRGFNAFSYGATKLAVKKSLPRDVARAYRAPYNSWSNRRATLRFVQDIPLRPSDESYACVKEIDENLPRLASVPKLICWGRRDFVFDRAFLAEWVRRCPEAEVHSFSQTGHYCLEDAGAKIVPLIADFLERHPLAPASTPAPPTREATS